MAFDYKKMQTLAYNLLSSSNFGDKFVLQKPAEAVYDPVSKKRLTKFEEHNGVCVKKKYEDIGVGKMADVIEAGDVVFVCQMDDKNIIPVKNKDKIVFASVIYNIIEVITIDPCGKEILVHHCYARKAN